MCSFMSLSFAYLLVTKNMLPRKGKTYTLTFCKSFYKPQCHSITWGVITFHARGEIRSVNSCIYGKTGVKWIDKTFMIWNHLSEFQGESPNTQFGRISDESNALIKNDAVTCHQDFNSTARYENITIARWSTRFFPLPGGAKKII